MPDVDDGQGHGEGIGRRLASRTGKRSEDDVTFIVQTLRSRTCDGTMEERNLRLTSANVASKQLAKKQSDGQVKTFDTGSAII